uniref:Uncharacterized protein LOC108048201 n=1 Tax=Drosophila rhopaloa TaxID=1041015 RepID=A0A6P4F5A1_DRORH
MALVAVAVENRTQMGMGNAVRCILTCHTLAGDYTSVEI